MGITKLLDIIVGLIIVLAVSVVILHFYSGNLKTNVINNVAQETAYSYDTFGGALNSYVQANFNNNISGTVSCSTLKADNFLSSGYSCTDPIGETLSGYISSPWGFPQTWLVAPTTTPNISELSKFGINNELQWESFTYMVAQDAMNENNSFKGFSVNSGNQFTMPDSGVVSNLSDYFPSSNVEFSQVMPSIAYYDGSSIIVSPSMQKNPDYWLFNVSMYLAGNTANIDYQNLGYSAVCPVGGVQPGVPASPQWTFMMGNLNGSNPNSFVTYLDWNNPYLSESIYLCIPTTKSMIDINKSVFTNDNYSGAGNYNNNQINITGPNNVNGSDDSHDTNGENQVIPQVGQVYYINDGVAKYTLVIDGGFLYMTPLWLTYYEGVVLWEGQPASYSDIYIESSLYSSVGGVPPAPVWPVSDVSGSPITINLG